MENTVKVFSHYPSLVPLNDELIPSQWSEKDWDGADVKESEVFPGW